MTSLDMLKGHTNNTEINNTEYSNTDLSILSGRRK